MRLQGVCAPDLHGRCGRAVQSECLRSGRNHGVTFFQLWRHQHIQQVQKTPKPEQTFCHLCLVFSPKNMSALCNLLDKKTHILCADDNCDRRHINPSTGPCQSPQKFKIDIATLYAKLILDFYPKIMGITDCVPIYEVPAMQFKNGLLAEECLGIVKLAKPNINI